MVHVALAAVEQHAAGVVDGLLQDAAGEGRPVAGDAAAAHGVGVDADIRQHDGLAALAVKAQHANALVHIADGCQHIRVVDAGVGAGGAILHAEAADEGDAGGLTHAPAHLGGLEVIQGEHGRVAHAGAEEGEVLLLLLRHDLAVQVHLGTGVGVGAGDEDMIGRHAGLFGDILAQGLGELGEQAGNIRADQDRLGIAQGEGDRIGLQLILHMIRQAHHIVAADGGAHGGGDVHPAKADMKLIHYSLSSW